LRALDEGQDMSPVPKRRPLSPRVPRKPTQAMAGVERTASACVVQ
jgi:hypothetical protein